MLEAKDLVAISADRFSLLESVRSVTNPTGVAATVSIAIGKDGADYREDYAFAALAVDMALSQAAAIRSSSKTAMISHSTAAATSRASAAQRSNPA